MTVSVHHFGDPVPLQIHNHMGSIDSTVTTIGLIEQGAVTAEDIERIVGGDQFIAAITIQIRHHRRGVPAGLTGQVHQQLRR